MMDFYPVVGTNYLVTEDDGSKNEVVVRAVDARRDQITFEYVDAGLLHYVDRREFAFNLNAYGVL